MIANGMAGAQSGSCPSGHAHAEVGEDEQAEQGPATASGAAAALRCAAMRALTRSRDTGRRAGAHQRAAPRRRGSGPLRGHDRRGHDESRLALTDHLASCEHPHVVRDPVNRTGLSDLVGCRRALGRRATAQTRARATKIRPDISTGQTLRTHGAVGAQDVRCVACDLLLLV